MKLKLFMIAGALLVLTGNSYAGVINHSILSGSSWKSSSQLDSGWETAGFNDSGWDVARAPYPGVVSPTTLIPGTVAQYIWHDPVATSNGKTGVNEAFFRYTFDLNLQPDSIPVIGQALISVDDDYDFFVNGDLIHQNHDDGFASVVDFVDFTSSLQNGGNIIAIHAVDGGWDDPRDRLYERVLFDGSVSSVSAVPIPGALWLFISGLATIRLARLRVE